MIHQRKKRVQRGHWIGSLLYKQHQHVKVAFQIQSRLNTDWLEELEMFLVKLYVAIIVSGIGIGIAN